MKGKILSNKMQSIRTGCELHESNVALDAGMAASKTASLAKMRGRSWRGLRATVSGTSCILAVVTTANMGAASGSDATSACPTDQNVPEAVVERLDTSLRTIVDGEGSSAGLLGYAPGAELFVRSPEWTYHRSIGTADLTAPAPLDCGRPFQIGSNTKMMTATLVMQLDEEGVLALDDPLAAHLPEIAASLAFGDRITLRQLANHTSGIFSYTDNAPNGAPGIMEGALSDPSLLAKTYTPQELVRFVVDNGKPTFEPGAEGQWAYSNTGYVLIGMILEKVTGKSLDVLLSERIFAPLGMQDSFLWNAVPKAEFNLPHAYYEPPFDLETTDWNMSQAWAAGGVISTSHDMDLFIRALLDGALFDKPTSLSRMMETVSTTGSFAGYGIGIGKKIGGFWGHGGQTLGFESDVGLFRDQDISLVLWTNSARNLASLGATLVYGALGEADMLEMNTDKGQSLAGTRWKWVSTESSSGQILTIGEPERYTVFFQQDGDLALKADCNRVLGSYATQGEEVSLVLGASTKAMCPPDSLDDRFLQELQSVIAFRSQGDSLVLSLGQERGPMEFVRDVE